VFVRLPPLVRFFGSSIDFLDTESKCGARQFDADLNMQLPGTLGVRPLLKFIVAANAINGRQRRFIAAIGYARF
jgi:hypothetical protein